jgi:hypothetical protein
MLPMRTSTEPATSRIVTGGGLACDETELTER